MLQRPWVLPNKVLLVESMHQGSLSAVPQVGTTESVVELFQGTPAEQEEAGELPSVPISEREVSLMNEVPPKVEVQAEAGEIPTSPVMKKAAQLMLKAHQEV